MTIYSEKAIAKGARSNAMMTLSPETFLTLTQWAGILTIVCAVVAGISFALKWGIRFRLVGTTGFMLVLTTGLFALSLFPIARTSVPGAVRYVVVYDNGANQAVISVPNTITRSELEATLQQAASDLYSLGRGSQNDAKLTIRARTILHPQPGVSQPLILGQVQRSLAQRNDPDLKIDIYGDRLRQLPPPTAS